MKPPKEHKNTGLYGVILVLLGLLFRALSDTVGGSHVQDFVSGVLMGLSAAVLLAGILLLAKAWLNK